MKKKTSRSGIDIDVEELDRIIDAAMREPLNEHDGRTLKTAVHAMAERLVRRRNTEKISAVLEPKTTSGTAPTLPQPERSGPAGHGRNPATAFTGAERVRVKHPQLKPGDICPECREGKVYCQKEPKTLVRIVGRPPLQATVFEMERLRCLCLMRHKQRYAASGTMPHRELVNLRPIFEEQGFASRRVPGCGITGTMVTGL